MSIGYRLSTIALIIAFGLSGCATVPPPVVSGNGSCHPSTDLPAHKTVKKPPQDATLLEDTFALLGFYIKDDVQNVLDYNSLYEQCVGVKAPTP